MPRNLKELHDFFCLYVSLANDVFLCSKLRIVCSFEDDCQGLI
jgi:hypothetical protein